MSTAESYDCHFFKVTPKLARVLNCRQLAVLHSVWEAIEDAGLTAQDLYRTRTGVWVASFVWQHPLSEAPDECDLRWVTVAFEPCSRGVRQVYRHCSPRSLISRTAI